VFGCATLNICSTILDDSEQYLRAREAEAMCDHVWIFEAPGTADVYTIVVTNNGPSTVSSVTLTDTIPAALLNPSFGPSAGIYDLGTGVWSGS
jgi:uncharacterized repeat protein (TIGR01451 family)